MGAKGWDYTAESTRVPGKDVSKEKKTKKIKKNLQALIQV